MEERMSKLSDTSLEKSKIRKIKPHRSTYSNLRTFRTLARKSLDSITEARNSVQYAFELLSEEEYIWPDQCDYAIDSLQTIVEPVKDFCALLDKATELPLPVMPQRPQLLMKLYFIKDQVQKLTLMLHTFRSTCQDTSKSGVKQWDDIYHEFKSLLEEGLNISNSRFILYQASSQEYESYFDWGSA
jgi:hypothetical protein